MSRGPDAIPLGGRSWAVLSAVSLLGLGAFGWPLVVHPTGTENLAHAGDAPWIFALMLPLLLAVVLVEVSDGVLDSKAIAMLGVLAACGAALRIPGGGATGFEPVFFLLFPAGRVFGAGFGFVLGALTLFASALITGGVGPWLPFQMLGAAWVGFFAGCLPGRDRSGGRGEVLLLAGYGVVAGLAYGLLLNFWFWPFTVRSGTSIAFVAGDSTMANLHRFWTFHLATSLAWDIPRATTNAVLTLAVGRPVLRTLRRAARRAAFGATPAFEPAAAGQAAAPSTT